MNGMPDTLNDQLLHAVTYHKVPEVMHCLREGADPNYDSYAGKPEAERENQPWSPLRMVMFCISDSLLDENGLQEFAEVTRILLQWGADPQPAMEIAESRYGKYNEPQDDSTFMKIWKMIADASNKK